MFADTGLDESCGIVFRRRNLLEGRCVNDVIHLIKDRHQAVPVANITEQVADGTDICGCSISRHLELLKFIAAEDDEFFGFVILQKCPDHFLPNGAGAG